VSGRWTVPLFDLQIGTEEIEAVTEVLRSGWLSLGPETEAFEGEFDGFLGRGRSLMVNNATNALHLAYVLSGLRSGDEIVVPSLTFVSSLTPALWLGASPRFADVESETCLNVSRRTVEAVLTDRTRVVTFVHYAGFTEGIEEIRSLCEERGLVLVEDASHAHGSTISGQKAGTIAPFGVFSFFANKNLSTGEGGALVLGSDRDFDRARLLRSHGLTSLAWQKYQGESALYDVVDLGYNYKPTELQAALARVALRKLPAMNQRRRELVALYRSRLSGAVAFPFEDYESSANYILPVVLPPEVSRENVMKFMADRGIQTSVHYTPIHLFSYFRKRFGFEEGLLPVTEEVGRRELTLPLYPHMKEEQVAFVCEEFKEALGEADK
jgi:dTDP-4-amino-4,6-dideoxygalactose transaminase